MPVASSHGIRPALKENKKKPQSSTAVRGGASLSGGMSYADIARPGSSSRPASSDGGDKDVKALIARVFRLQTEISRLKADVQKIGSARDTQELRQKVGQSGQRLKGDAQQINQDLQQAHKAKKTQQTTKIVADFESALKDLENTMKVARSKEAASLPKPSAQAAKRPPADPLDLEAGSSGRDPLESAALLQEQKQKEAVQLDSFISYNEALIDERDQGIAELGQQISDVHEMFQDLAVLVNDQGGMLDDIEANISTTAANTQDANVQLGKAERSQRASRNRACFFLFIVGIILAVLVLILAVQ